jgi:hypothetical protein
MLPYKHLFQAAVARKTIQFRATHNSEWEDGEDLLFSSSPHCYRVKPDAVKTKRYWYTGSKTGKPYVMIVAEVDQSTDPRENWVGFTSWIDAEWQEHGLPEKKD